MAKFRSIGAWTKFFNSYNILIQEVVKDMDLNAHLCFFTLAIQTLTSHSLRTGNKFSFLGLEIEKVVKK